MINIKNYAFYKKVSKTKDVAYEFLCKHSLNLPFNGKNRRKQYVNLAELCNDHFMIFASHDHPCRSTLTKALELLENEPKRIVETGSAAWGANSSILFDSYVNSFGGSFESVDIRYKPGYQLRNIVSSKSEFYVESSVDFLSKNRTQIDLLYLDSCDVDWNSPLQSSIYGLHEFLVCLPYLNSGSVLLVDDTPRNEKIFNDVVGEEQSRCFKRFFDLYGFLPGKGGLIHKFITENEICEIVAHDYQLLCKF